MSIMAHGRMKAPTYRRVVDNPVITVQPHCKIARPAGLDVAIGCALAGLMAGLAFLPAAQFLAYTAVAVVAGTFLTLLGINRYGPPMSLVIASATALTVLGTATTRAIVNLHRSLAVADVKARGTSLMDQATEWIPFDRAGLTGLIVLLGIILGVIMWGSPLAPLFWVKRVCSVLITIVMHGVEEWKTTIAVVALGSAIGFTVFRGADVAASGWFRIGVVACWILEAVCLMFIAATLHTPEPAHVEDDPEQPETSIPMPAHRWMQYISAIASDAHPAGALPGFGLDVEKFTRIHDPRPCDGDPVVIGWQAPVKCPPGTIGAQAVVQAVPNIATTMEVGVTDVEIVRTKNNARPIVRVIHESVTAERSAIWTPGGVDLDAGTFELGTYPDGLRSKYQLWTPDGGAWHGWLCGGTGSGKSSAMHALLARVLSTGRVVLDLAPIGGGSMYAWKGAAFRYGDSVTAATQALKRGVAVMDARSKAAASIEWTDRRGNARIGRDPLPNGAEWPIYWVVIDEFPRLSGGGTTAASLAKDDAYKLFKRIAAEGRKWRVALLVASQGATLAGTWWGDSVLRENVRQGNVVVLSGSKGSAGLALDHSDEMAKAPDVPIGQPGLGYVMSKVSDRMVMSRTDWVADDEARPDGVPDSHEVAEYAVRCEPNPVDLEAIAQVEGTPVKASVKVQDVPSGVDWATEVESILSEADGEMRDHDVVTKVVERKGLDRRPHDAVRAILRDLHENPASPVHLTSSGAYAHNGKAV